MQNFVRFTLQQKVVLNLLFVLLMVIGAFTLLRMPVERYPNIQFGTMYINTFLPGASPEDVETLITKEIEEGLEDLEEVEYIRSSSYKERSNIVIKFEDDSDYEKRFDDVRLKTLSILSKLPELPEPPVFNFLDVNDWFPTISVNVAGDYGNAMLTQVAETIKIPLAQLDGVREVQISGDFTQEFHIIVSQEKLQRAGMTFPEVARALENANIAIPGGQADTNTGEFVVRVDEQFSKREEIVSTIIRRDGDGSFIRINDVMDNGYFSFRDPFVMASVNGQDCVTLQILKNVDGNAVFIAEEVRELVANLQPNYAKLGIKLEVNQDSSVKIKDSLRVLGVNLILGVLLVCTIIWMFMGFRNAALTTIGIPFAFLVTMILMDVTGNSVNEVSLFAFVLVSGIIVDDAIVVVENIFRHHQMGKAIDDAIIDGTSEVFLPVISATLTTLVAFIPMLIMTGTVGDFFAIVPKTIAFALVASILECLFILPCHYRDFGPKRTPPSDHSSIEKDLGEGIDLKPQNEARIMRIVRGLFHNAVIFVLKHRLSSLLALAVIFIGAVGIFLGSLTGLTNLMRIQFFPDDYSLYYIEVTGPPGTSLERINELIKKIAAQRVSEGPGITESALGFAGFYINDDFSPNYGTNQGYVAVTLPSTKIRRFADYPENDVIAHLGDVREKVEPLIPQGFGLSIRPEKDGPPSGKDINIRILGQNPENVSALATRIENFLRSDDGVSPYLLDLQDDQGSKAKVFRFRVDREKAAEHGLTVAEVARLAAAALQGQIVGEMKRPRETIDIRLKLSETEGLPMFTAMDLEILQTATGSLRLGDVCTAEFSLEPGHLNRFERQRAVTLTADLLPRAPITSPMVINKVKEYYAGIRDQYSGASLNFSGEHESTTKSFTSLAYAFLIAIVMIYLILAAQFKSYFQPLIIIAAVVFALIGVILGTVASRTLFTVNSFVAVVGVTGVVVNDSLVLVEFINKCYKKGMRRFDALMQATHIRLRPILLTTLTTTLGLLPMALGIPEYSVIWGSMAMTFVTGLCTATFLTIIIIPLLWDIGARFDSDKKP